MNNFGELLYSGKTDTNKNGFVFLILGILSFVGSNFIYVGMMLMVIGGVFTLIGLYLLLFIRSEEISIYENTIIVTSKGKKLLIPKEQISHIEYQKLRVRRSPIVNYYPQLVLKNQNKVLLNKAFNSTINQDFKKVIESYIG